MENSAVLNSNKIFIMYKKSCRYMKAAILLHIISLAAFILFLGFGKLAICYFEKSHWFFFYSYAGISIYWIVLIAFAQLDALSRFQNYKQAKDLFFENGFKKRIADIFVNSRCQRDAIKIAAIDLGVENQLCRYYDDLGYRWFHIIPNVVFHKPAVLFTRMFWKKTLLAESYTSKYFLW